ncbi:UNVERIFIED_ORG: hypothetical protein DFO82_2247 [Idiomarina abyssalis]|uniref:phosphoribosyltransferase-like protein n=1 Tax=Idiomarina sp. 017G TaxID=2183988 RepID=UPI000E0EE719|nr:hypothetical protein [Idiomarina sp. 017G]TDO47420.1 hypothetical protein DEU30_1086 [Idiomarina sp. 017G]
MFIKTEKTSKEDFYSLASIAEQIPWLDDREYQSGILALWEELEDDESKKLVVELLKRLEHLNDRCLNDNAYLIVDKIKEWEIKPENVLMVATSDGNEIDGSVAGLQFLKNNLATLDDWSEKLLFSNFEAALVHIQKGVTEVLVFDDFIGSGKTMVTKLKSFKNRLAELGIVGVNFRILGFAAMNHGVRHIEKNLKVEMFCPVILRKGISDYESDKADEYKKMMLDLESNLQKKYKGLNIRDFALGYKGSETLYQVYGNNCSNNVFPLFWWPKKRFGKVRNTLFRRLR